MRKLGMLVVGAFLFGAVGCDDGAIDKGENALRCRDMCGIVDSCLNWSDAQTEDCREECREKSENDDFESKVETCQKCLDGDNSCSENAIDCTTECAGVITVTST